MGKIIDSDDRSLGALLIGEATFVVPEFQRPFSWRKEHVDALFDDLVAALPKKEGARSATAANPLHFIGSLVLLKPNPKSPDQQRYEVIDGQQRLTTLTLIFCAIRDQFLLLGNERLASKLHETYIVHADDFKDDRPRLELRVGDNSFFEKSIIQLPKNRETALTTGRKRGRPAINHLRLAYENLCSQKIPEFLRQQTEPMEALRNLYQHIANNTVLIVTAVEDLDTAHTVFETLNTRGLDLSVQDLLRNLLKKTERQRN